MMKRAIVAGLLGLMMVLCSVGCVTIFEGLGLLLYGFGVTATPETQAAKDRDLGAIVEQTLKTACDSRPYIVSFKFDGQPGVYRCVTKDLPDGQAAWKFAYNAMVRLIERNDTKVQTGRHAFRIIGVQNGQEIFQVTYTRGPGNYPQVALTGLWAGEVYDPTLR